MAKTIQQFVCSNCGFAVSRWQGKCPECESWNTFAKQASAVSTMRPGTSAKPVRLHAAGFVQVERASTGMAELDLVLGGGLVPGSLVLLGGDPGIGKSTLALQTALYMSRAESSVLYISGEESAQQIKLRADNVFRSNQNAPYALTGEHSLRFGIDRANATTVAQRAHASVVNIFS